MKKILFSSILVSFLATTAVADVLLRSRPSEDGRQERVQLLLEDTPALRTADVAVSYDPARQSFAGFRIGEDARGALVAINAETPGLVRIAIASAREFAGVAPLGELIFLGTGIVQLQDAYVFTNEEDEAQLAYKLSPFVAAVCAAELGDVDLNTKIEEPDALRILDAAVGKVTLSTAEACRADVTVNGAVTAYDAAMVMQTVAGQCFGLPTDFLPSARAHGNCVPTTISSSPANTEGEVAVTRETIIRFSNPLSDATTVTADALYAEFGGQRLSARIHVAPDRKTATLFYNNDLPASARVRVTVDGDLLRDALGDLIDANNDGAAGGIGQIDFDTLTLTVLAGTRVCGRVFASEVNSSVNTPLQGVRISVDGMDLSLRVDTDANGNFCLDPSPVGKFFVHIDGRTATNQVPQGAYYPFVGKAWESKAGQTVNIENVYLPLVAPGTLQPVSTTQDTTINFPPSVIAQNPAFADVKIVVPADSLYSETGARGGSVGIAPVPPDRIPSPLPPGLNLPIVITVQTDGATNFDRLVPVCFPNLPDPQTGQPLAAGAKSALWSFNHDTGDWEIVGPMTVSADGKLVCSDAGSGLRFPGWVGSQPGNGAGGDSKDGSDQDQCPPPPAICTPPPPDNCDEVGMGLNAAGIALGVVGGLAAFGAITLSAPVALGIAAAAVAINVAQFVRQPSSDSVPAIVETATAAHEHVISPGSHLLQPLAGGGVGTPLAIGALKAVGAGAGILSTVLNALDLKKQIDACNSSPPAPLGATEQLRTEYRQAIAPLTTTLNKIIKIDKNRLGLPSDRDVLVRAREGKLEFWPLEKPGEPALDRSGPPVAVPIIDLIDPQWLADPAAATASLNALVASAQEAARVVSVVNPTYRAFQEELKTLYISATSRVSSVSTTPTTASFYVVTDLQTRMVIRRGKTSSSGRISFIAPTDRSLLVEVFNPSNFQYGVGGTASPGPGQQIEIPPITTFPDRSPDTDQDGLGAQGEFVIGTNPGNRDTDGDGISDGAEITQGTNPLDNLPAATGIVASVDTPGSALDLAAFNNIAVLAEGAAGVAVLNVFGSTSPVVIAQVDTPGTAEAVDFSGRYVAVADGLAGLAIIDISDPPAARVVNQVSLANGANEVAVAGELAFVASGEEIVLVDLARGAILDRRKYAGGSIHDLSISGDYIYALAVTIPSSHTLHKIPLGGTLEAATASLTITEHPTFGRMHLFAGVGFIYIGSSDNNWQQQIPGVAIVRDDGVSLTLVGPPSGITAFDVAVNGSGLAIFTGADPGLLANPRVGLLDVTDPTQTNRFITSFQTPGGAEAVSIYNGFAYVADRQAGVQVINYLPADTRGVAPSVSLATNFASGVAEEGKLMRLTASVTDDVQVRNVEFYIDGVLVATDGNFPFEHRMITPLLSQKSSFTIRARAIDTGGNATSTADRTITLTADATAPTVKAVTPKDGSKSVPGTVKAVSVTFSEPMKLSSLTTDTILLYSAGADGVAGTADDSVRPGGTVSYLTETNTALLAFATPLPDGLYRSVVKAAVSDLLGNQLGADFAWTFRAGSRTVRWISQTSGFWHEGARWDVGTPPETDDIVIIDVPADVTVTYSQGTTSILKLDSNETLLLTGGELRVTGPLQVNSTFKLQGGTLTDATINPGSAGQGLTLTSAGGTLSGVTINSNLDSELQSQSSAAITGGLTLNGTAKLGVDAPDASSCSQAAAVSLEFSGTAQTLGGNGTIRTGGFPCYNTSIFGNSVTISSTIAIRGPAASISGTFFNNGIISVDGNGRNSELSGAGWQNNGTIEAKNGSALFLVGTYSNRGQIVVNASTLNLGGTFTLADLGVVSRTGGTVNLTGILNNSGTILALNSTTGSWRLVGGTIQGGTITQTAGSELIFTGQGGVLSGVTFNGDMNLARPGEGSVSARVRNGLTLNGTARLSDDATDCFQAASGQLTFEDLNFTGQLLGGTATIIMSGSSTCQNFSYMNHQGALTIGPGITIRGGTGGIDRTGDINPPSVNRGIISADVSGRNLSMLGTSWINTGTIEAKNGGDILVFAITNSGIVKPGLDPFPTRPAIRGLSSYTQDGAGTLHIDVAGLAAGTQHSQLMISGTVSLAGTLATALLGGYAPNVGDSFTVLTYGSVSGSFTTISGSPGAGKAWQANYTPTALVLTVVSSP